MADSHARAHPQPLQGSFSEVLSILGRCKPHSSLMFILVLTLAVASHVRSFRA